MAKSLTPEQYHELAKSRGFTWLGPEVIRISIPTRWSANCGHIWEASYSNIQRGTRCGVCFPHKPIEDNDYINLAKSRGIEWISRDPDDKRKCIWRCPHGHTWSTRHGHIKNGHGCPYCAGNARLTPDHYRSLAAERGFVWVESKIKSVESDVAWICPKGHKWLSRYSNIKWGNGCPHCAGIAKKTKDDFVNLANSRGFTWVESAIGGVSLKYQWICSFGHRWSSTYSDIRGGYGCPHCAGNARRLPVHYKELAKTRGFKWIGPEVKTSATPTGWQCKHGHRWLARYNSIARGQGCPRCNESKGERLISETLKSWHIEHVRQKRFQECKYINHLKFDFFIPGMNVLIEYQGIQHYKPLDIFGGEAGFAENQRRDSIKRTFAKENGYYMIEVPYTVEDVPRYIGVELGKATGIGYDVITTSNKSKVLRKRNPDQKSLFDGMIGFLGL